MIPTVPPLVPFAALMPLLLSVALGDLREYRIPNAKVLAGLALFALTAPFLPAGELNPRLLAGGLAFLICFALYAWGKMGGGDAKLLPVILLFVPAGEIALYLFALAAGLALGIAVLLGARRTLAPHWQPWPSLEPGAPLPVGLPFALSGICYLALATAL